MSLCIYKSVCMFSTYNHKADMLFLFIARNRREKIDVIINENRLFLKIWKLCELENITSIHDERNQSPPCQRLTVIFPIDVYRGKLPEVKAQQPNFQELRRFHSLSHQKQFYFKLLSEFFAHDELSINNLLADTTWGSYVRFWYLGICLSYGG